MTFVNELVERIQYLQRDCSMDLVNPREKLLLIAGSAALRGCPRRRGFSPDVLLLGRVFHQRPSKFRALPRRRRSISERRTFHLVRLGGRRNILFVISGFVIANSASKSSPKEFLFGRALRLYPAVWIGSTLSLLVLLIFAREKASEFILPYFQAMLLIPKGIKGQWLDAVYWTLAAEMAFYGLVFCTLLTKKVTLRHLERFPPDVNQFIGGDSLAAANQILSAIIGSEGDGGKGVFDGLERSCGGLG